MHYVKQKTPMSTMGTHVSFIFSGSSPFFVGPKTFIRPWVLAVH